MNDVHPHPATAAEEAGIRTWRVGSLSMGVTLMMIGIALAVSIWQDAEAYELLLWVAPVVFIMLGAELLLYLKFSDSKHAVVRYDWISVFFVGLVGSASLGLALLMSTGVFDGIKQGFDMAQRSFFIETEKVELPPEISRVVVHSLTGVQISEVDISEARLLGQVRYWSAEPIKYDGSPLMRTNIVGTTMYIMIGSIDYPTGGFFSEAADHQLTLVLPQGIQVEHR